MKKSMLAFLILLLSGAVLAQTDSIFLDDLMRAAQTYAALAPQAEIREQINEHNLTAIRSSNLPSLQAYGKAWYQSDAIAVPMAGMEIDKFQYNAGLEVNQKLFDGGMAKKSVQLQQANFKAEQEKLATKLHQYSDQAVDLFFRLQLMQNNTKILELKEALLEKRLTEMQSAFRNGVIRQNDLDEIQAELLSTRRQVMDADRLKQQLRLSLEELSGIEVPETAQLLVSDSLLTQSTVERPEYRAFEAQIKRIEEQADIQRAKNLPKLYAYGQLGYSYPGLNFFENQSDYYYMAGAKLSWTIFDWNKNSNESQAIRLQKQIVETEVSDFSRKIGTSIQNEIIEQAQLQKMIELGEGIVEQRKSVTEGSEKALENGVITASEYLEDVNAEVIARIELEVHRIQLMQSKVKTKLLQGIALSTLE